MKKIALLSLFVITAFASNAQYYLTGTSYVQNFDAISPSLPLGWVCYISASSISLGSVDVTYGTGNVNFGSYYDTLDCAADVFGTGFKNSASYTPSNCTATCATQEAQSNRCLAVRQSGSGSHPGFDPGAAFCFHLANTHGCTNMQLGFSLQSLDQVSPRTTTWEVDYGFGALPTTFTAVTPTSGTLTTGGGLCDTNHVVINFGSALDNHSGDVWIRIATIAASTGSGNRTTSGIDNFSLSWTGTATTGLFQVSSTPSLSLTALGYATSDDILLGYTSEENGAYNLNIFDIAGRVVHTEVVNAIAGEQRINVTGLHLVPGMYVAKMSNATASSFTRVSVQ